MKQTSCRIVHVGKRRDGGMRYWCLEHRGDATAKYGVKAKSCRYADTRFGHASPTRIISAQDFPGGIALWGAVPPVYDTSLQPLDAGIHVHARKFQKGKKDIDETYPNVELQLNGRSWRIEELDAINQMTSSILGTDTAEIPCPNCGALHLDKDWFGVHPHSRHLCSWCGQHFKDCKKAVGNPAAALAAQFPTKPPIESRRKIRIQQRDFPGGIRIWGSNKALVWTSRKRELSGIHLHCYAEDGRLVRDETFGQVTIDGLQLDSYWIRVLMAQKSLPHLAGRIVNVVCPNCGFAQGDIGTDAFTPRRERSCGNCHQIFVVRGRIKKVIANPVSHALELLSRSAVREPAKHDIGLLVESP